MVGGDEVNKQTKLDMLRVIIISSTILAIIFGFMSKNLYANCGSVIIIITIFLCLWDTI